MYAVVHLPSRLVPYECVLRLRLLGKRARVEFPYSSVLVLLIDRWTPLKNKLPSVRPSEVACNRVALQLELLLASLGGRTFVRSNYIIVVLFVMRNQYTLLAGAVRRGTLRQQMGRAFDVTLVVLLDCVDIQMCAGH